MTEKQKAFQRGKKAGLRKVLKLINGLSTDWSVFTGPDHGIGGRKTTHRFKLDAIDLIETQLGKKKVMMDTGLGGQGGTGGEV